MYKIKKYIFVICMMLIVALVSLLVVSVFTYMLKWHADKAMLGIVVTYILSGFAGGFFLGKYKKKENQANCSIREKLIEAICVSALFFILLGLISILGLHIPFSFSGRLLLILFLLTGSACLGRVL